MVRRLKFLADERNHQDTRDGIRNETKGQENNRIARLDGESSSSAGNATFLNLLNGQIEFARRF